MVYYIVKILQVREINLLRESNMQLREENKHNFEECQVCPRRGLCSWRLYVIFLDNEMILSDYFDVICYCKMLS